MHPMMIQILIPTSEHLLSKAIAEVYLITRPTSGFRFADIAEAQADRVQDTHIKVSRSSLMLLAQIPL
jgi:hypothetical protein